MCSGTVRRYEGQWVNDQMEGQGVYMSGLVNGARYRVEGKFVAGRFEGHGKAVYSNWQDTGTYCCPLGTRHVSCCWCACRRGGIIVVLIPSLRSALWWRVARRELLLVRGQLREWLVSRQRDVHVLRRPFLHRRRECMAPLRTSCYRCAVAFIHGGIVAWTGSSCAVVPWEATWTRRHEVCEQYRHGVPQSAWRWRHRYPVPH